MEFLIWDGVKTKDEAIAAITNFYWSKPGFYAIELTAEKKCIGCFALRLKPDHEKASFGYMLNKKYWGNGYMTETLTAILSLCFEKLELNRVESTHYKGNEASGRVMQKCGMKQEGIGIQQEKIKGVFRDTVHYGITRDTY
jgi:ribosomal-protein-alanine N-acetyltransferase